MENTAASMQFFLQLAGILAAIKAVGFFGNRYLGQPRVVCEMITGVLLGPTLFGTYFPKTFSILFPEESIAVLYSAAQLGLVLYMFIVGCDFRIDILQKRAKTAFAVSGSGIAAPFVLAGLLTLYVVQGAGYFSPDANRMQIWLFLGAAISITAFPVMARIIHERGIAGTPLGTIALAAGSIDDAVAWCILAIVLASFTNSPELAWLAIGGGILYALVTLTACRRLFAHLYQTLERQRPENRRFEIADGVFCTVMIFLTMGAWITDAIGIHAVFGAFLLGVAMPRGKFSDLLQQKIEPITVNLLLPLFFVYSGLNTNLLALGGAELWVTGIILCASILAKFGACSLAALLCGENFKCSAGIGALMNARGLTELILLNIGYDKGIISETLFSALVLMALVTTLLASPLFVLIARYLPGDFHGPEQKDSGSLSA